MYGIGALMAPLIAGPFMAPQTNQTDNISNVTKSFMTQDGQLNSKYSTFDLEPERLNMLKAYAIIGTLVFLTGIAYLIAAFVTWRYWKIDSHNSHEKPKSKDNAKSSWENGQVEVSATEVTYKEKSRCCQLSFGHVFGMLLCLYSFAYCLIEHTIGMFSVTFAVEYSEWTKGSAVFLFSIFFVVSTISRGVCALLAKWMQPKYILFIFITITVCSSVALALSSRTNPSMLWVCICGFAVGNSPLFPVGVTYCNQYMVAGAALMGFLQLACTTAAIVSPFTLGRLYDSMGPVSFIYILLVASCLLLGIFACMHTLGCRHGIRTINQAKEVHSDRPSENGSMEKAIDNRYG